jgi:hypothetical protein
MQLMIDYMRSMCVLHVQLLRTTTTTTTTTTYDTADTINWIRNPIAIATCYLI